MSNHPTPVILDDEALTEIEARANAATEGPWQSRFIFRLFKSARMDLHNIFHSKRGQDWPDSEFIAHARTDIPALCQTVRALRAELNCYCRCHVRVTVRQQICDHCDAPENIAK